jgi:hypothetical protein
MFLAGARILSAAAASLKRCAWARKPMLGAVWSSFCRPAVSVQTSSYVVGRIVTQA